MKPGDFISYGRGDPAEFMRHYKRRRAVERKLLADLYRRWRREGSAHTARLLWLTVRSARLDLHRFLP